MSKPASTVQNIVQPLTQFSASLFVKLPVEIQLEILSHCQTNDLVCLSLVSRFFRTLTMPLTPKKPSLLSYDQNLSPEAVSAACGYNLFSGVEYNTYSHRRRHHAFTFTTEDAVAHDRLVATQGAAHSCRNWMTCRRYPPDHPVCRRPWCRHCVCISCPLYTRLRGWMGEDLKYCQKCRKFTKRARTKKYQGRCKYRRSCNVIVGTSAKARAARFAWPTKSAQDTEQPLDAEKGRVIRLSLVATMGDVGG